MLGSRLRCVARLLPAFAALAGLACSSEATPKVVQKDAAKAGWSTTSTVGAPEARSSHVSVWTGSRMIVWGGTVKGTPNVTGTGGVYDPETNAWTPTSTKGAPSARTLSVAVWTGSKMIVWGGYGTTSYLTDGGIYDPSDDTWKPMTTTGAPSGRTGSAVAWTGSKLVVWGGVTSGNALADGGSYDPASDTWKALPAGGPLSPRHDISTVVAPSGVILWGGYDAVDWFNDGVTYDPASNTWGAPTASSAGFAGREHHSAVWTGADMVVWGGAGPVGFLGDGASYDPTAGTWTALASADAPSPRSGHSGVWTGSEMFVWGGCAQGTCTAAGDGALWTPGPKGGTWTPISADSSVVARSAHTAVWTGTAALVWGGQTSNGLTDTGALFTP